MERVLRVSVKSCLFFQAHRELHPPWKRKPPLTTCPKHSPFPLKYCRVQSWRCVLKPFFLWAAALLHKNEEDRLASESWREAVGFRLRQMCPAPPPAVGGGLAAVGVRLQNLGCGRMTPGLCLCSRCFLIVTVTWPVL